MQIDILESSFALLAPRGTELVARFYERLFERYPEVKPMFRHVDMIWRSNKRRCWALWRW
jgi:methyl-accepting chemotaxis protein